MTDNPYLMPSDADDDIFNPEREGKTKHNYDGTPCTECGGAIHAVSTDTDIPPEVQEELDRLIDSLPDSDKAARVIVTTPESPANQILKDIQDFFSNFSSTIPAGPAIRAVVETLDQMTQGQTTALIDLYTKEQQIIIHQDQIRVLDQMCNRIDEWLGSERLSSLETLKEILGGIKTNLTTKITELLEEYVQTCDAAERTPRADLLGGSFEGDPDDIKFRLMFYYVTSTLAREYILTKEEEKNNQDKEGNS